MTDIKVQIDIRHRTCEAIDPDDEAPVMVVERMEDDMAIVACPRCNHKVSFFVGIGRA